MDSRLEELPVWAHTKAARRARCRCCRRRPNRAMPWSKISIRSNNESTRWFTSWIRSSISGHSGYLVDEREGPNDVCKFDCILLIRSSRHTDNAGAECLYCWISYSCEASRKAPRSSFSDVGTARDPLFLPYGCSSNSTANPIKSKATRRWDFDRDEYDDRVEEHWLCNDEDGNMSL